MLYIYIKIHTHAYIIHIHTYLITYTRSYRPLTLFHTGSATICGHMRVCTYKCVHTLQTSHTHTHTYKNTYRRAATGQDMQEFDPGHTCIHTYIHTYMHTYIHTCMHTYIHIGVQQLARICKNSTLDIHAYIHTYIHTHAYIHTYIHAYIHTYRRAATGQDMQEFDPGHTCIHTYMHTYIHAYIHTYIHTGVLQLARICKNSTLIHVSLLYEIV